MDHLSPQRPKEEAVPVLRRASCDFCQGLQALRGDLANTALATLPGSVSAGTVVCGGDAVFWGANVPGGSYHSVFNGPGF